MLQNETNGDNFTSTPRSRETMAKKPPSPKKVVLPGTVRLPALLTYGAAAEAEGVFGDGPCGG